MVVILGIVLADIIEQSGRLSRAHNSLDAEGDIATVTFWLSLTAAAATVVLASLALFPRTRAKTTSLAFWGDVANHPSGSSYAHAISEASDEELTDHLSNQVWELSRIAKTKFELVRWSYVVLLVFLALAVVSRVALRWSN